MKKILAAGALAAMVLGLGGAIPAQAKAFTEIKFGVDATYPPFRVWLRAARSRASTSISAKPSVPI